MVRALSCISGNPRVLEVGVEVAMAKFHINSGEQLHRGIESTEYLGMSSAVTGTLRCR